MFNLPFEQLRQEESRHNVDFLSLPLSPYCLAPIRLTRFAVWFFFFQLLSKKNCLSYLFILSLVRHFISFSQLPGWFILQPRRRHLRWVSTWYIPNKPRSKRVYSLWPKPHNSYERNCRRERLHRLSVHCFLLARVGIVLPYVYWRFLFITGRQISSLVSNFVTWLLSCLCSGESVIVQLGGDVKPLALTTSYVFVNWKGT